MLLKLFTRVLNVRLDKVVEKQKFLSEHQFGFRKNKSTSDAIFVVTTAIEKAKQEGMDAGLASIDLSAAYDMVSRTALFKKLYSLGISGSFLEILQDYYTNDSVVYVVGTGVTKALYLIQGVKQGCNLSPLLFNLFLVDVIEEIHRTKLGIKIGQNIVTIISYADDLIILVECIENLNKIIDFLKQQCGKINMNVNAKKSKIIRIGHPLRSSTEEEMFSFDQVLACKYLGVLIEKKAFTYYTDFSDQCYKKSRMYKFSVMSKAKDSHDPALVARELWNKVALPSILYGSEVIPIRGQELRKINSEATQIGKFILQLPRSTTNITPTLIAGIEQIEYSYYKRVLAYKNRIENLHNESLAKQTYEFVMNSNKPFGYRQRDQKLERILRGEDLETWYVNDINNRKQINDYSCRFLPEKLYPGLDNQLAITSYTEEAKILAEFMTMNSGLGNRSPIKGYKQHKLCQVCQKAGQNNRINEIHLLFECVSLKPAHIKYGTQAYKQKNAGTDSQNIYKKYWSDYKDENDLNERIKSADTIRNIYLDLVKRIHNRN